METFSQRLVQLRASKNLTMKEVATQISVPVSTYRDWEYGTPVRGEPYSELAKVFGVSLSHLITGKENDLHSVRDELKKIQNDVGKLLETLNLTFL